MSRFHQSHASPQLSAKLQRDERSAAGRQCSADILRIPLVAVKNLFRKRSARNSQERALVIIGKRFGENRRVKFRDWGHPAFSFLVQFVPASATSGAA